MIYLLLIAAIVSAGQCSPVKPVLLLPPELSVLINEKATVCQIEEKADPLILKNLLPWNVKESETNGRFLYCLMLKMGFEGADGHLNEEKFMDIFGPSLQPEKKDEVRDVLVQCNKQVGKNQYFTIYKVANCFHTNSPVTMSL